MTSVQAASSRPSLLDMHRPSLATTPALPVSQGSASTTSTDTGPLSRSTASSDGTTLSSTSTGFLKHAAAGKAANGTALTHAVFLRRPDLARQATSPVPPRSPERHHRRALSAPRETKVKETLDARVTKREDGMRMLNQYVLQKEIGRGAYGTVLQAVDSVTGKEYAIKEFSKARLRKRNHSAILRRPRGVLGGGGGGPPVRQGRPSLLSRRSATDIHKDEEAGNPLFLIRSELAIMKKLDHENVIDLLEVLDDPEGDALYMVLELCKKGVIMQIGFGANATPFSDEECRHYFRDLILGIEYLHAQGIAHRDIKPDNLLLSQDSVLKIADFGVSELFQANEDGKVAQSGSPAFMSPELCHGARNTSFLKASDIWSMGVTLFCWKFGTLPFGETNLIELCADIMNNPPILLDPSFPGNERHRCDENLLDLFEKILEKDPERRITMDALREHPWVTCDGEDELLSVEENTAQMVQEITEEDMREAIKGIRGAVAVAKAVFKFKQMRGAKSREPSRERRSISTERGQDAAGEDATSQEGNVAHVTDQLDKTSLADNAAPATQDTSKDRESDAPKVESSPGDASSPSQQPRIAPHDMPRPTITKRSRSMDAASARINGTEDRILWHARLGLEPGREQSHGIMEEASLHGRAGWEPVDLAPMQRRRAAAAAAHEAAKAASHSEETVTTQSTAAQDVSTASPSTAAAVQLGRSQTQGGKRGQERRGRGQTLEDGARKENGSWRPSFATLMQNQALAPNDEKERGRQSSVAQTKQETRVAARFRAVMGEASHLGDMPENEARSNTPRAAKLEEHHVPLLHVGGGLDYHDPSVALGPAAMMPVVLAESPSIDRTGVSLQGELLRAYEANLAKEQLKLAQADE